MGPLQPGLSRSLARVERDSTERRGEPRGRRHKRAGVRVGGRGCRAAGSSAHTKLQQCFARGRLTPRRGDLLSEFGSQQIKRLAVEFSQARFRFGTVCDQHYARELFSCQRLRRQQVCRNEAKHYQPRRHVVSPMTDWDIGIQGGEHCRRDEERKAKSEEEDRADACSHGYYSSLSCSFLTATPEPSHCARISATRLAGQDGKASRTSST